MQHTIDAMIFMDCEFIDRLTFLELKKIEWALKDIGREMKYAADLETHTVYIDCHKSEVDQITELLEQVVDEEPTVEYL